MIRQSHKSATPNTENAVNPGSGKAGGCPARGRAWPMCTLSTSTATIPIRLHTSLITKRLQPRPRGCGREHFPDEQTAPHGAYPESKVKKSPPPRGTFRAVRTSVPERPALPAAQVATQVATLVPSSPNSSANLSLETSHFRRLGDDVPCTIENRKKGRSGLPEGGRGGRKRNAKFPDGRGCAAPGATSWRATKLWAL